MQHWRQRAQAAGAARNHKQPPTIAEQGSEAAQNMRRAQIVGVDIIIDYGTRVVVRLYSRVMIGKDDVDAAMALGQQVCETFDCAGLGYVQEFAAHLCSSVRQTT